MVVSIEKFMLESACSKSIVSMYFVSRWIPPFDPKTPPEHAHDHLPRIKLGVSKTSIFFERSLAEQTELVRLPFGHWRLVDTLAPESAPAEAGRRQCNTSCFNAQIFQDQEKIWCWKWQRICCREGPVSGLISSLAKWKSSRVNQFVLSTKKNVHVIHIARFILCEISPATADMHIACYILLDLEYI